MYYGRNLFVFLIFIATSAHGAVAQFKFGDAAKIEESNAKQGGTTLPDISSRFLDLGGVISQLFSGFNQGSTGGRGPSLNLPPNSQFYTGVPAQTGNSQIPTGTGNYWPMPDQDNKQNSGIQNQQQWNQPNQNSLNFNNNLQPIRNQGWQNFGPNLNNNPNRPQGVQNPGSQLLNVPWIRNQGNNVNKPPTNNEGTLDDFFRKDRDETENLAGKKEESNEDDINEKNAIWGKQVMVPTTKSSDNIVFRDHSETPSQKECVQNCPTTSEYAPVCGTDDVTYFNPGRLICARNCGIHVFEKRRGTCRTR